ncbi:MAG: hypothetical protein WCD49_10430 [Candidatus Acidiferrales bacterium]|jgi:hypothetical protein
MDDENAVAKRGGVATLLSTLLLVSPCFFAWACSWVISQGGPNSHSGTWFIYQVSQYLAGLGLVVAAVLTIINGTQHAISRVIVFLMALSILCGISALWYAVHIYRSPWY